MLRADNAPLRHHRDGVHPTGDVPGVIPLNGEGLAGLDPLGTGPTAQVTFTASGVFLEPESLTITMAATVYD
jgi:hypothetical protein